MTQRNASFFSLHDRGVIETGKRGDLAVFALDEIETRDFVRAHDLPDGGWRFTPPERRLPRHGRRPARRPCSTASPPATAPPPSATPSAPPAGSNWRQPYAYNPPS